MAPGPITSCLIDGKKVETVTDFILLGSKITMDSDCSHEIKRHLLAWKKSCDQPRQHIKKQRHYLVNKGAGIWWTIIPQGHVGKILVSSFMPYLIWLGTKSSGTVSDSSW